MLNLFLTGFMGAGKSTVGKLLAEKIEWEFVDTDRLIESRSGKSIAENFAESEEAFRALESEIVSEVILKEKQVVALGGGALVKSSSRLKVLGAGNLVYLKTTPHVLLTRLKKAKEIRPLLEKQKDKEAFIENLLKERESVYQAANFTIETDGKAPEAIAHEVMVTVGMIKR